MPIEPMDEEPRPDGIGRMLVLAVILLSAAVIMRGLVAVVCGI